MVDGAGVVAVVLHEVAVGVPALESVDHGDGEFDEADAAFDEAAGDEALAGVGAGVLVFGFHAVEPFGGVGFAGEGHHFGDGELHAGGELVVGDGVFELGGVFAAALVEAADEIAFECLQRVKIEKK